MNIKTKGIILKQTNYSEADKMLTVFTEEFGIISVKARGARRYKSHMSAAAQVFCYNEFVLFASGGYYSLVSADIIESFYELRNNFVNLALANYLADITYTVLQPANPDASVLKLLLNMIYALANATHNADKIKCAFELRLMSEAGYMPQLQKCGACASEENISGFDIGHGCVVCASCLDTDNAYPLSSAMHKAMQYILYANEKKILAFDIPQEDIERLNTISQRYVSKHSERDFASLTYYTNIKETKI